MWKRDTSTRRQIKTTAKTSWPEVVGMTVEAAILNDKPDADIVVLPVGSPATKDLRPNRVGIFGTDTMTKTSWPEVVGMTIEAAKAAILKDKPDADIVVLPVGSPMTRDLRPNRVHIFGSDTPPQLAS
uniref:Uncharacterized protein n=1 Tax=Leersia perrieri TaxID=77586 RepID=A0A0D9WBX7_9ORYZ